jgi:hypothetical protein
LIPNHFHLLLRSGSQSLATVMRRLLTGHGMGFNRRHRRSGQLFQNRYKSILCQNEPYLLEMIFHVWKDVAQVVRQQKDEVHPENGLPPYRMA